ncbi:MAG: S26 family signal peptidase [Planctomycetota bacterium]
MPDASTKPTTSSEPPRPRGLLAVKEGLTSIVIAFALAFVFRGFVLEAFLIPTGSMAPTLLGQHHRFIGPNSGYQFTTGPWVGQGDVQVRDPMVDTLMQSRRADTPRLAGDRIFVLKYLPPIYRPKRWDVSVFKYPPGPTTNYIKRMIGLPNEQVALIDGDVFVRPAPPSAEPGTLADGGLTPPDTWNTEGWTIARKPERVQRAVWQDVWDSRFAPPPAESTGVRFRQPWQAGAASEADRSAWEVSGESVYRYTGASNAALVWDADARPFTDRTAYNQTGARIAPPYPVSDIATLMAIEPEGASLGVVEVGLSTRRHGFRAILQDGAARLEIRDAEGDGDWQTLATGELPDGALQPGRVTPVEFWHHDQRLTLWVDGRQIAQGDYDWTPVQRVRQTFGIDLTDQATLDAIDVRRGASQDKHPFAYPSAPTSPRLQWTFGAGEPAESGGGRGAGAGFTIHRSVVKRDLHYQAGVYTANQDTRGVHSRQLEPFLATHPCQTPTLGPDQFVLLGDNSPASADARMWDHPSPWVADQVDDTIGVVHRDLLIGRAFIVYFPAPHPGGSLPVPDAGRVRWIF